MKIHDGSWSWVSFDGSAAGGYPCAPQTSASSPTRSGSGREGRRRRMGQNERRAARRPPVVGTASASLGGLWEAAP